MNISDKQEIESIITECDYKIINASDAQLDEFYGTVISISVLGKTINLPFEAFVYGAIVDVLEKYIREYY